MRTFLVLLKREWLEWRKIIFIGLAIYAVLLLLMTYGLHKTSVSVQHSEVTIDNTKRTMIIEREDFIIKSSGDSTHPKEGEIRLEMDDLAKIWGHALRGLLSLINFLVIIVAISYLADAVYKERADGSTFYFRSLPVRDVSILGTKLTFGTMGILFVSYVLGGIAIAFLYLVFPRTLSELFMETGFNIGVIDTSDLLSDWAVFHVLQLLWLMPFALYFLLISSAVKARPFLTSIGILLLISILWKVLLGDTGLSNHLTVNIGVMNEVLQQEWLPLQNSQLTGDSVELFGSFNRYVFSFRSLASLGISVVLFLTTLRLYQRNMEVS